jgi:hypothetical protein
LAQYTGKLWVNAHPHSKVRKGKRRSREESKEKKARVKYDSSMYKGNERDKSHDCLSTQHDRRNEQKEEKMKTKDKYKQFEKIIPVKLVYLLFFSYLCSVFAAEPTKHYPEGYFRKNEQINTSWHQQKKSSFS